MKKSMILLIALTVIGSFSLVSARRHGQRFMYQEPHEGLESCMQPLMIMPWEKIVELADEIKLDETQLDAIEKARNIMLEQKDTLFEEMDDLREKLHEAMTQIENSDLETALELSNKLNILRLQHQQNRIKSTFELKKILAPEQQERLKEMFRQNRCGQGRLGNPKFGPGNPPHRQNRSTEREDLPRNKMGRRMGGRN